MSQISCLMSGRQIYNYLPLYPTQSYHKYISSVDYDLNHELLNAESLLKNYLYHLYHD